MIHTFFQKKNSQISTKKFVFFAKDPMSQVPESLSTRLDAKENSETQALRPLRDIAGRLENLSKNETRENGHILQQLDRFEGKIPKQVLDPIRTHLNDARKALEKGKTDAARTLILQAQSVLEKKEDDFWLKRKKNDSNTYLRRTDIFNPSDASNPNPVLSPYIQNPFIGNLEQEARVNYEMLDPKTNTTKKDQMAEKEQRALNGLPIFDKEGNPKTYKATSEDGSRTLHFYWVPNLPGQEYLHLGGHFALTGQRKEIPAFIPHGWRINEEQTGTDKNETKTPEKQLERKSERVGILKENDAVFKNITENNAEARNNTVDAFQTALAREIKNENLSAQTDIQRENATNTVLSIMAVNNIEFETIYQSLPSTMQASETIQVSETPQISETTQTSEAFETRKASAITQTSEKIQPEQSAIKREHSNYTTETQKIISPETISKDTLVETLSMLFSKIKTFLAKKIEQQKKPTSEQKTPEYKKEEHEAIQAITFLEQVYANIAQKSSERQGINMDELLSTQKKENADFNQETVDEETTEIIQINRKNLTMARAVIQEPLAFDN
ncbi:hypothetical protein HYV57_03870 [Candidatus Peregrinibacteria bacterium]|nr:hypothetical protein [Candidatus Peregrinibacteria bacterium]